MLLFSLIFLSSSLFFTNLLGGVGFILANCVNMATRIAHSCHFIHSFFSPTTHSPLVDALPSMYSLAALVAAFLSTTGSEVSPVSSVYCTCPSSCTIHSLNLIVASAQCPCVDLLHTVI